mmetsp:Transcript_3257/g.6027  ORF Transcript_3257/g.6027 Transcript_3257/m.6027 type:complete len:104 (-) Transcript_3257:75-386(-)
MQRTEEAGSGAPGAIDAHARTRDKHRGGGVEVGRPRVADERQPTADGEERPSTYHQRKTNSCLPTNSGEGVGLFVPKMGRDNKQLERWEMEGHLQGWRTATDQ